MLVAIKKNSLYKESEWRGGNTEEYKEKLVGFGYKILSVAKNDVVYSDFFEDGHGNFIFDESKYEQRMQNRKLVAEMRSLKEWFDTEYASKVQKYTRLIALREKDYDGGDPEIKLMQMYRTGKEKNDRIRVLEAVTGIKI